METVKLTGTAEIDIAAMKHMAGDPLMRSLISFRRLRRPLSPGMRLCQSDLMVAVLMGGVGMLGGTIFRYLILG